MIRFVLCFCFLTFLFGCQKPPQDTTEPPEVKVEVSKGPDGQEETKSSVVDP